jgi:hypothetical protein
MLFTDQLAQAIAEGRKFVTRRPITPRNSVVWIGDKQTKPLAELYIKSEQSLGRGQPDAANESIVIPGATVNNCDFPAVTICPRHSGGDMLWVRECWRQDPDFDGKVWYRARADRDGRVTGASRWRPSIHMPRRAARSVRRIVSVAPERLGPLSEAEAIAEGFESPEDFAAAWAGLYGGRVRWVWRYEFERSNAT